MGMDVTGIAGHQTQPDQRGLNGDARAFDKAMRRRVRLGVVAKGKGLFHVHVGVQRVIKFDVKAQHRYGMTIVIQQGSAGLGLVQQGAGVFGLGGCAHDSLAKSAHITSDHWL